MNSNPMQMINEFNRFKNGFNGDPRAMVENLVASGQISQKDLIRIQKEANDLMTMMRQMGIKI